MTEDFASCPAYVERFAAYYRRLGFPCWVVDGRLWLEDHRMITAVGPVSMSNAISKSAAEQLLCKSRRAILVRCTDGFQPEPSSPEWYSVICKSFVDLDQYNAKKRSQIRKGLRECEARKVDSQCIAGRGYEVYVSALARYAHGKRAPVSTRERFRQGLVDVADFDDVIDSWAVFHHGAMVGYARNCLYGNTEVGYSMMSFNPECFQYYSAYALIYRMNEYYLREKGVDYVNDGFRTLLHSTELQQMLITKFGFEKAHTHLYLHYKPPFSWLMSFPAGVRTLAGKISPRFAALNALHQARSTDGE